MTIEQLWRRLPLAALTAVVAALPFYRFGLSLGGQSLAPHEVLLGLTAVVCGAQWLGRYLTPPAPQQVRGGEAGRLSDRRFARMGRSGVETPTYRTPSRSDGGPGQPSTGETGASQSDSMMVGGGFNPRRGLAANPPDTHPGGKGFDLPIALLLVSALLSLLATEYLRLSLRELRILIVEPLLFWYLCRLILRSSRDVIWLVGGLLVSATLVAVIGLVQLVAGGAVTDVQGVRRVLGTYSSPNHFALLLGRALPFWLALGWCLPRWRLWAIAGGLLCAGALGATFSVGGWLATGLALLVVVGRLGGRRPLLALLLAGALAGAVVFLTAPVERLAGRLDPRQGTSFVRVQLWQTAAQLVTESPLLGIGLDNFLYRYPALMPPGAPFEPNLSHPHNLMLQFWLQLGILGVVALGWLLWRFGRLAWSASHTVQPGTPSSLRRALAVGALGSMTDFVAHGLVDNSYFLPDMAVIFWLTIAVVIVASTAPPRTMTPSSP